MQVEQMGNDEPDAGEKPVDLETCSEPVGDRGSAVERQRRKARDRMRTHRGKTAETVRPYMKLDALSPDKKKTRKRRQDQEARQRFDAKRNSQLPPEELDPDMEALNAVLAELDLADQQARKTEAKRKRRCLEQRRYRKKKRDAGKGTPTTSKSK